MYDKNYQDYMAMTLGYNLNNEVNYNYNGYDMIQEDYRNENIQNDLEQLYPEIYKIIYPMICKACMNVRGTITEDVVINITNEIFMNFEDSRTKQSENRNTNQKNETKQSITYRQAKDLTNEDRNQNFLLKDLIRILVLRELINSSRPGNRPGPRPPMPPHNRPPLRPRTYTDLYY